MISGGVLLSLPGQNGQKGVPLMTTVSREKSLGRLERSVDMITQRPMTGSFRNSGTVTILRHFPSSNLAIGASDHRKTETTIFRRALSMLTSEHSQQNCSNHGEGIFEQHDVWLVLRLQINTDHIKPVRRPVGQLAQEVPCDAAKIVPLFIVYGSFRRHITA